MQAAALGSVVRGPCPSLLFLCSSLKRGPSVGGELLPAVLGPRVGACQAKSSGDTAQAPHGETGPSKRSPDGPAGSPYGRSPGHLCSGFSCILAPGAVSSLLASRWGDREGEAGSRVKWWSGSRSTWGTVPCGVALGSRVPVEESAGRTQRSSGT